MREDSKLFNIESLCPVSLLGKDEVTKIIPWRFLKGSYFLNLLGNMQKINVEL